MPLRIAKARDLPQIARIFADAFWDDRLFGEIMHPHRQAHPNDYRRHWQDEVTEWYWNYSHLIVVSFVVEKTKDGSAQAKLTGAADWERQGAGWEQVWGLWGRWDPRNAFEKLVVLRKRLSSTIHPNRAADPAMLNVISDVMPFSSHMWSGHRATGWYLNALAADPACQKQGYGRDLARWGIERAQQEGVVASVISGEGKDAFYQRCGFDIKVGNASEGEGNPLAGKRAGGNVFFSK